MRNRRRHLVGSSAALLAARSPPSAPAPRPPSLARSPCPSLASEAQKPFLMPQSRPTERRERPTDDQRPQPQRLLGPRGAELAGLLAALLRPLGRPGPRRARTSPTATATASPTSSNGCCGSPNTSTRSRTASSAGASRAATAARAAATARPTSTSPRSAANCSATRRRTAARRPSSTGSRGGCTATSSSTTTTAPSSSPDDQAARRPRGHLRPRVQPHPPVRLRRLPGPLVRRVDRDLDGGPGLQRDQRLPALRPPLGEALGNAADGELDQGVRQRRLEPVAGAALRARRSSARPGPGRSTPSRAASRSPATNGRSAPPGPRTSATTSPASPPTSPSGGPARASARAGSTPTCRGRAACRSTARRLTRLLNHTTFQLLRVRPRRRPRRRGPPDGAARHRGRAGAGRPGRQRAPRPHRRCASTTARGGGQLTVRLPRPGRFAADHRGRRQRRRPRRAASASATSTGTT